MSSTTLPFGPSYKKVDVGEIITLAEDTPLVLDSGAELSAFSTAYQTYGTLNTEKTNAILICHGLTGDQYLCGTHPVTGKPGWWEHMVGPGKPIDTDQFYVICANVLGGCMGTAGPKTLDPKTKKPYGLSFPVITIADMVRAQRLLLDALGIDRLFAVIGGSMGGMLAVQWAISYPEHVHAVIPIATAARHTAQNIAFHEIGRQAIMADPGWCEGKYITKKRYPIKGLAVARMTAHVTYLSESGLHRKFGRELQDREQITYGFEADFQIESYLRHQGITFVERFDPNAYLYITRAMDYFDLEQEFGGNLGAAFAKAQAEFCVISFSSDWLFPAEEAKRIVHALSGAAPHVSFVELTSDKGHDAFLLHEPQFFEAIRGFLTSSATRFF